MIGVVSRELETILLQPTAPTLSENGKARIRNRMFTTRKWKGEPVKTDAKGRKMYEKMKMA